jgi:hypothetical protein
MEFAGNALSWFTLEGFGSDVVTTDSRLSAVLDLAGLN